MDRDRDRHYSQQRHPEHDRYRDIDIEEGLMDSTEQGLQDISRTSKLLASFNSCNSSLTRSDFKSFTGISPPVSVVQKIGCTVPITNLRQPPTLQD